MSTRRERIHDNVREEIKGVARQHMAAQGTAAISLRAIARDMEMTAPGLYRYFASRDELITALILDAFLDCAEALQAAYESCPADDPIGRLEAIMLAYRDWAITHPTDFALIYGNPIPDYQQTPEADQETGRASQKSFEVVGRAIVEAIAAGALIPPPEYVNLPEAMAQQLAVRLAQYDAATVTPTVMYLTLLAWSQGHGLIMLELDGHLQPIIEDIGALYRHRLKDILRQMGAQLKT